METKTVRIGGAVTLFSIQNTHRAALCSALDDMGLEKYYPAERTDFGALKAALGRYGDAHTAKAKDFLVLPNENPQTNGVSCFEAERSTERVHPDYSFTAKVVDGTVLISGGHADRYELQAMFDEEKRVCTGQAVGQSLIRILSETMDATCLRDSGGVYWLAEHHLPEWDRIAASVEACAIKEDSSRVYRLLTPIDEHTVKAVGDSVAKELEEAAKRIAGEIADGREHKPEYYDRRAEEATLLTERAERYESILGTHMTALKAVLGVTKSAAITAAMSNVGV